MVRLIKTFFNPLWGLIALLMSKLRRGSQPQQPQQPQPNPTMVFSTQQEGWISSPIMHRLMNTSYISFRRASIFLPIIASIITLILYFSLNTVLPPNHTFSLNPALLKMTLSGTIWGLPLPIWGLILALLFIPIYSILSIPIAIATTSGMQDYALLETSEKKLHACLGNPDMKNEDAPTIQTISEAVKDPDLDENPRKRLAANEARNTYRALYHSLYSGLSFRSVLSAGDVYAWGMVHRTEEAFMEFGPLSIIIREAMGDHSAIQNSNIDDRDRLLERLIIATTLLDAEAAKCIIESQNDKNIDNIREYIQKIYNNCVTKNINPNQHAKSSQSGQPDPDNKEMRARAILRYIKHRLNEFRENRLAGLMQARNNLVLTIVASGFIAYALLYLGITGEHSPEGIISATAFYIIGVTAGLFGRLYAESKKESAVNDYGLSRARLLAIPLISGLSAIGGVFITALAFATSTGNKLNLADIFSYPIDTRYILTAMIFGFAPNLLIKNFQQKSDQYASELERTKGK